MPGASLAGPVLSGWSAATATATATATLIEFYCAELGAHARANGNERLIDLLDVHFCKMTHTSKALQVN